MKTNILSKWCASIAALAALTVLATRNIAQTTANVSETPATTSPSLTPGTAPANSVLPAEVKHSHHAKRVEAMNLRFLSQLLKTKDNKENPSFSPLAVAIALEALKLGAGGNTAKEIATLLAYPESGDAELAEGENSTWTWLSKQTASADWSLNHGLWYHKMNPLLPSYLDLASRQPSLAVEALDFSQPTAAKQLSDWAAKHSAGKLNQPIAPSGISDLTRMVWISLLNYKGKWQSSFDPKANTRAPFHSPGVEIQATMMHGKMDLRFVQKPGYGAVAVLPMAGNHTVLEIRLPERPMTRAELADWVLLPSPEPTTLAVQAVKVSFPRTEVESSISWLEVLTVLGANELLSAADFSKATQEEGLRLSELATETSVRFDEQGAEVISSAAAAVQARGVNSDDVPLLLLDRPFFWTIRSTQSGLPVASGLLERPTAAVTTGGTENTKPESPSITPQAENPVR